MPAGRPRTARCGAVARRGRTGSHDHDALAGTVLGDPVRARGREDADSLGVGRQPRRHGAEERHRRPRRELGHRALEPDDEAVSASVHAAHGLRSPGLHGRGADDLPCVGGAGRTYPRRKRAVDGARERAGLHRRAVAEAEASPDREHVRLAVARDGWECGRHLRLQPEAGRRGLVRVGQQPGARQVEQRPAGRAVRERRIDRVEADGPEADAERAAGASVAHGAASPRIDARTPRPAIATAGQIASRFTCCRLPK